MKYLSDLRAEPDVENKKLETLETFFHTFRYEVTDPIVSFGHYHSAN